MSAFWTTDDYIQIGEKSVSIPAENGLTYTVASVGRKVSFEVPKTVEFISGKDSYLEFDLKVEAPAGSDPTRLQLDSAGGGMCVQNLRIYDGGRGNLIEEINDYNQIVSIIADYDTDDSLRATRSLMEGGTVWNRQNAGSRGSSKSELSDLHTNPYFKASTRVTQNETWDNDMQNTVHCCVPIHSGVFSGTIFPNMLTGLYIELDLMPATRIVKQLDSVVKNRRRTLNPYVLGVENGAGTALIDWAADGTQAENEIYMQTANGADHPENFPFVVGEKVGFVKCATGVAVDDTDLNANLHNGGAYRAPKILIIERVAAPGLTYSCIKVTFDVAVTNEAAGGGRGAVVDGDSVMISLSAVEAVSYIPTYTMSDLNLVCHEVIMDDRYKSSMLQKIREGSAIEFDIHSVTNYKNSMTASERQASFLIHANNERAKSLIIVPTDATVYTPAQLVSGETTCNITQDEMDGKLNQIRAGIAGVCDGLSTYQFQLDGKLVPSRQVSTRKIATKRSIDAFPLFELEKALANADIAPHSFSKFQENFIIGRGFAVNRGVSNLQNKDLSVQLAYAETIAPTVPKLMSTFVFHLRRLTISGGSTVVSM